MSLVPIVHSKRLFLRPVNFADSEDVFRYRSDAITNKYQGWIPDTIYDVHDFINKRVSSRIDIHNTWFQFVIIERKSNELIGDIGLYFLDAEKFQVEIGFTLDKNYQGKGYAAEAISEIINKLFTEYHKRRIIASVDPRNKKSISLLKRLGFRKEAHFKESIYQDGEWLDDVVYAMLKNDWYDIYTQSS